jgi:peptidoglycan/xylan/chitin deacetylase (PgdA/CDA1 family)
MPSEVASTENEPRCCTHSTVIYWKLSTPFFYLTLSLRQQIIEGSDTRMKDARTLPVRTGLFINLLLMLVLLCPSAGAASSGVKGFAQPRVPILIYHRFGPVVADSMTVTTAVFESQLKYLRKNGYTVIPLRSLVDYFLGKAPPPPPRAVVITSDDGHRSVYTDMLPLVKKYRIPVTLFIYPSAISNASYAMTWEQLREIKRTGLFDIQSHTYWHPNFKKEKKRLKPEDFEKFVDMQLKKSKARIEKEVGGKVDMLAWPFGIYDDWLMKRAKEDGYIAGFTIVRQNATPSDNIMALPRYIMTDRDRDRDEVFGRLLADGLDRKEESRRP